MAPYKEKTIEKMYWTIGEVADMFEVNASLIRFWEKEFDALKPKKNKKGNRLFTAQDIENLRTIHHLVKEKGFTLAGAKIRLNELKSDPKQEALSRLTAIRTLLEEMREEL